MKRTLIICTLCLFGLITNAQDLSIEKIFSYTLKDYSSIENYFITNGYDFIKLYTSSEALNLYWSELHYSSGKSFDDTTISTLQLEFIKMYRWYNKSNNISIEVYVSFTIVRMVLLLIDKESYLKYFEQLNNNQSCSLFDTKRYSGRTNNLVIHKIFNNHKNYPENQFKTVDLCSVTNEYLNNSYHLLLYDEGY